MYTLVRTSTLGQLVGAQLPTLLAALGIAEAFYKFHSFLLEAVAFLITWFLLDYLVSIAGDLLAKKRSKEDADDRHAQER